MEKSRHHFFEEITIVKGIAILLVMLGHAITQTGQEGVFLNKVHQVIYSFHMPLFFFASGFLSVRLLEARDWRSRISYIGSRTLRLLIPYFFVGILYMFAGGYYYHNPEVFSKGTITNLLLGLNMNPELWFLYVLWLITITTTLLVRRKTLWFWLIVSCVLSWRSYHFSFSNGTYYLFFSYTFYVVLGMLVRCFYSDIRERLKNKWIFFGVLFAFGIGNYVQMLVREGKIAFSSSAMDGIILITAFWGIVLFVDIAIEITDNVSQENRVRKFLALCGVYCMDLYILSAPIKVLVRILFWETLHWNYLICTFLCFFLPLVLVLVISKMIIRKSMLLSILFLGGYDNKL